MDGSASPTCWKMDSPEAASAPRAEMKPSMAKRPLMVSGPAPEKAMASPKETDFFTGAGGGGGGWRLLGGADDNAVGAPDAGGEHPLGESPGQVLHTGGGVHLLCCSCCCVLLNFGARATA